jgi:dihydrolipoamide dehydrogenase
VAEEKFDLVVIGAGPGGYVAALRASQLGLRTACIDRNDQLGGTCLRVGCIPSKALLHSSERYAEARHTLASHGVVFSDLSLDLATMMSRKSETVDGLAKGIAFLLKKNGVERIQGQARIEAPGRVAVETGEGESKTLRAERILVATGSTSAELPGVMIDEKRIVSSTGALAFDHVPERLIVIGAGAIGLELGSVWSRLGAEVTVLEFLDHVLPGMDREIGKHAQRVFARQGLTFQLSSRVTSAQTDASEVQLTVEPADGGEPKTVAADAVLVAIGRRPRTADLGLEALGVALDDGGFIHVDESFATSVPGIYAIGDCVPGPMLAHKAEEEGVACVERMAGQSTSVHYERVPAVVYTWPEVAAVGATEEELKERGVEYRVGKFSFQANSRARVTGDTDGFVKVLADAGSDELLGVHILGPMAGDLLAEAVVAMEFRASAEDLARTCHAHPALAEALKEAALAAAGRALHA